MDSIFGLIMICCLGILAVGIHVAWETIKRRNTLVPPPLYGDKTRAIALGLACVISLLLLGVIVHFRLV